MDSQHGWTDDELTRAAASCDYSVISDERQRLLPDLSAIWSEDEGGSERGPIGIDTRGEHIMGDYSIRATQGKGLPKDFV